MDNDHAGNPGTATTPDPDEKAAGIRPCRNGQPTAAERAIEALALAERLDFRDCAGAPIRPGVLVHYVPRTQLDEDRSDEFPGSVWNTRRWGMVVGIVAHTHDDGTTTRTVSVHSAVVKTADTPWGSTDEWSCEPQRLKVIELDAQRPSPETT